MAVKGANSTQSVNATDRRCESRATGLGEGFARQNKLITRRNHAFKLKLIKSMGDLKSLAQRLQHRPTWLHLKPILETEFETVARRVNKKIVRYNW